MRAACLSGGGGAEVVVAVAELVDTCSWFDALAWCDSNDCSWLRLLLF